MRDIWKSWSEVKHLTKNKKVILFGRSEDWVPKTAPKFEFVDEKYIVDSNVAYEGESFYGMDIFSPEKLLKEDKKKLYIVITASPFDNVTEQLLEMGFKDGIHFCCTPEIRDWALLRRIREYDQDIIISCSDYIEKSNKRASKLGGGLYVCNTQENRLTKRVSGIFRQIELIEGNIYAVDHLNKTVHVISNDFKELDILNLDQSGKNDEKPNACGIAYHPLEKKIAVSNAASDTINIYDQKGFKFLEKIHFSDVFERSGQGQHHINDICIVGDYIWASYFSFSGNWKKGVMDGGVCQFDLKHPTRPPKVLVQGAWMPHSVKFFDGNLCYLDSMRGDFYIGNQNIAGKFPGFARGLTFDGQFYYIGQSENMYMGRCFGTSDNIMCNAGVYLFDVATKVSRFYSFPDMMNIHDLLILK
jgi:hypothetical protein